MSDLVRLLSVDIDGTMLRSDGTVSPAVVDALHRAVTSGLMVVPTTGRPLVAARPIMELVGLDGFWILANGAVTLDVAAGRVLRAFWLDAETVSDLIVDLRRMRFDLCFAIEFEESLAFEAPIGAVADMPPGSEPVDDVLVTLKDTSEPVQKMLILDPAGDDLDELTALVVAIGGERITVTSSGRTFVEVSAPGITKASALSLLAADLGLGPDQVAAVGDGRNDVSMLTWADHSFAMGNAADEARDAASEMIATNDDDGLVDLIDRLLATD